MSDLRAPIALTTHLALLSSISFGGFSSVLPDVRNFVVFTHDWMTDREFANFFALAQAIAGPNMILMMSFIGWRCGVSQGRLRARLQHSAHLAPCTSLLTGRGTASWPHDGSA